MVGWISDKRENGDMMFAVRQKLIGKNGQPYGDSGLRGPYLTLAGARKTADRMVTELSRWQDQTWFKNLYSGWEVKIEATLVDWQAVETFDS